MGSSRDQNIIQDPSDEWFWKGGVLGRLFSYARERLRQQLKQRSCGLIIIGRIGDSEQNFEQETFVGWFVTGKQNMIVLS